MAKPTTYKGSLVAIYLETATPDTFAKPCGLNNVNITFNKSSQDTNVPDCEDPEAPQWVERDVESLDMAVTGEGVLAAEALDTWWDAFASTDTVNARIYVGGQTDIVNGHFWEGAFHLNSFAVTGQTGQRAQVSISLASSGEVTKTAVTAP